MGENVPTKSLSAACWAFINQKASSISITPASKGKYAYFEALCREKLGDKEKADKLYREIIIENKSDYVGPSKSALARLGMIIEQYQN